MGFHSGAFLSQASGSTEQPPRPPTKKSRKTLHVVLGTVAVAAVVLAAVSIFIIPQSQSETIPLTYNYAVGENMVYNATTVSSSTDLSATGNPAGTSTNMTETETTSMQVVGFDGENYTMNYTTSFVLNGITIGPNNGTEMINKTGYVTILSGPGGLGQFSIPASFQKNQAKVGESWQFPMSELGNSSFSLTGNETLTFGNIQNLNVPAGTYKVFKINFSSTGIMAYGQPYTMHARGNGQEYLEFGTCRLIESYYQGGVYYEVNGQNMSSSTFTQTMLVNDTKP